LRQGHTFCNFSSVSLKVGEKRNFYLKNYLQVILGSSLNLSNIQKFGGTQKYLRETQAEKHCTRKCHKYCMCKEFALAFQKILVNSIFVPLKKMKNYNVGSFRSFFPGTIFTGKGRNPNTIIGIKLRIHKTFQLR
jgi:hypothetical protein